jgi:hypothetical protein
MAILISELKELELLKKGQIALLYAIREEMKSEKDEAHKVELMNEERSAAALLDRIHFEISLIQNKKAA